jgi:hypothetical protein
MKEMWTGTEFTKRNRGRMGIMGSVTTWLGVAFAIVGITSEATVTLLGLYPTSWYLLAVASFVFSLGCWLGWAVGIYLHTKEPEPELEPEPEPEKETESKE